MKILEIEYSAKRIPIIDRHHIVKVDEVGNRCYDSCGRPLYEQVENQQMQTKYNRLFLVNVDGEEVWMKEKAAKRAFSPRQVRKAIKQFRRSENETA